MIPTQQKGRVFGGDGGSSEPVRGVTFRVSGTRLPGCDWEAEGNITEVSLLHVGPGSQTLDLFV